MEEMPTQPSDSHASPSLSSWPRSALAEIIRETGLAAAGVVAVWKIADRMGSIDGADGLMAIVAIVVPAFVAVAGRAVAGVLLARKR